MTAESVRTARSLLSNAVRATTLRKPRGNPAEVPEGAFLVVTLIYLCAVALMHWVDAPAPRTFVGYGLVGTLADALLTLAAGWVLMRMAQRAGILSGVASVTLMATLLSTVVVGWPLGHAAAYLSSRGYVLPGMLAMALVSVWWLLVLITLARWLIPSRIRRALPAALLAFAVSAAPWWWLPGMPVFMSAQSADYGTATDIDDVLATSGFDGEPADAVPAIGFDPEFVIYDQPRMLDNALGALRPRVAGRSNLYVVAFAGDSSENVFRNEAEYVNRLFATRFGADGRIVVLQNNPATVATHPLATLTNLRWTMEHLAGEMDPAEDILLVYLTSHGSEDHELLVDMDPLPLNQITPENLAYSLRTQPSMRWKVLIVNACYSGGFIDALRDDSTLVISASRHDRTSFGCGADSQITWFGKAFLAEALNQTTSIPEAFALARESITRWESDARFEKPSEPQIATTRSIERKLERWRRTLPAAPSVPFIEMAAGASPDSD